MILLLLPTSNSIFIKKKRKRRRRKCTWDFEIDFRKKRHTYDRFTLSLFLLPPTYALLLSLLYLSFALYLNIIGDDLFSCRIWGNNYLSLSRDQCVYLESKEKKKKMKRISDLKVHELHDELTKRGLAKKGKKQELINRLMEFLVSQGKDPEEIDFDKDMEEQMESENGNDGTPEQKFDTASNEQSVGDADKSEQVDHQETTEHAAEENKQSAGEEVEEETNESKTNDQVDNAEKKDEPMEQGNDNQLEQSTTTVDNGIVDSQAAENKDEGMGDLDEEKLDYEDENTTPTTTTETKEIKPVKVTITGLDNETAIESIKEALSEKGFEFENIQKRENGFEIDAGDKTSQLIEQFHNQKLLDKVVKVEKLDETGQRKRSRTSSLSSSMSKDSKKRVKTVDERQLDNKNEEAAARDIRRRIDRVNRDKREVDRLKQDERKLKRDQDDLQRDMRRIKESLSRLRDENRKLRDDRRDFERDIERVRSNVKTEKEQLERDRRELKKLIEDQKCLTDELKKVREESEREKLELERKKLQDERRKYQDEREKMERERILFERSKREANAREMSRDPHRENRSNGDSMRYGSDASRSYEQRSYNRSEYSRTQSSTSSVPRESSRPASSRPTNSNSTTPPEYSRQSQNPYGAPPRAKSPTYTPANNSANPYASNKSRFNDSPDRRVWNAPINADSSRYNNTY